MSQSKQFDFSVLAAHLRYLINAKCNPKSCNIANNDTAIIINGGLGGMIPHSAIVLVYRFAMVHNLLMYFDTDNSRLVLH